MPRQALGETLAQEKRHVFVETSWLHHRSRFAGFGESHRGGLGEGLRADRRRAAMRFVDRLSQGSNQRKDHRGEGGHREGPIEAVEVVLKSRAHVVGDIHHQSLDLEKGAYFEGRSLQVHGANGSQPDKTGKQSRRAVNNILGAKSETEPAG